MDSHVVLARKEMDGHDFIGRQSNTEDFRRKFEVGCPMAGHDFIGRQSNSGDFRRKSGLGCPIISKI